MGRGLASLTPLEAVGTLSSLAKSCQAMLVAAAAHTCALGWGLGDAGLGHSPPPTAPLTQRPLYLWD